MCTVRKVTILCMFTFILNAVCFEMFISRDIYTHGKVICIHSLSYVYVFTKISNNENKN